MIAEEQFKIVRGPNYVSINGDSFEQLYGISSESFHFSIFSPPFPEMYAYSGDPRDLGNCKDYKEFFRQFRFMIPQIYRVMIPGRVVCVHCMDTPIKKGTEGYIGIRDFPGMLVRNFEREGFIYDGRITIWKNPVVEVTRSKALGLLNKQKDKDASMSRVGIPDYILKFRKRGDNPIPIVHDSNDPSHPNYLPIPLWQKYASPVWMDIDQSETLNREGREEEDEKHICPLQLEPIKRCVHLWTNPGEIVFTPFGGIGSEPYQSLKMGRKAYSIELKETYWNVNVRNCKGAAIPNYQLQLI